MRPIRYHDGQRAVQVEANSTTCADKLTTWVGPVTAFAGLADLIVLAAVDGGDFRIAALSGPAPLVTAREEDDLIRIGLPGAVADRLGPGRAVGGIVIKPAEARRSRVSGRLTMDGPRLELACDVGFTNCRKYMTPTESGGDAVLVGPQETLSIGLDDPWVTDVVARGETAFLVTATPAHVADVSHRGGPPGFLRLEVAASKIGWTEYLGDGMFVSTGNLRAGPRFALLVLDFATGDAVRLDGTAEYTNIRVDRKTRVDALIQDREPFPVQGRMEGRIVGASRLVGLCHPRRRVDGRRRITSNDTTQVQHPQ